MSWCRLSLALFLTSLLLIGCGERKQSPAPSTDSTRVSTTTVTPSEPEKTPEHASAPVSQPQPKATVRDTPVPQPAAEAPKTPIITFVELGSVSCIPCKKMQPVMREIEAKYEGLVKVEFHDVWKDKEIGKQYNIRLIPTQVFLDASGKEFYRHEGFFSTEEISRLLDEKLKSSKS